MAKLGDSFKQDSTFIFFDLYREGHPCLPSSPQAEIIGIGLAHPESEEANGNIVVGILLLGRGSHGQTTSS